MAELSNQELKSKTLSGVFWKGMERFGAQLVAAVVSIVLARILVPDDYSVVSIVTIFFTFCNIFISGGLNTALIQKKDSDIVDYSTVLIANIVMASVLYVTMFFCAPLIADLFKKDILVPIIRVMSLSFFINGYKAVLSAKITSDLQFKKFFWSTFSGTVVSALIGIVMALRGFGPWALVAQQMTNIFVDSVILTFTSSTKFKLCFSKKRFRGLFRFGGRIMLSSLINETYNQINPLIVGIKFSPTDLAFYNKGKMYPELIAASGSDTLSSALFPVMSKVQDEKEKVLAITRKFMQLSSFIIFPTMLGFFAVSELFVKIVLTDKWMAAVPFLMIFCISEMFKPIQTGNLQAIRAIGRSDVFLALEIVKKSLYLVIIVLFLIFANSPVVLAISAVLTSVLASVINSFPNRKLIGYGYRKQFKDLALNFFSALVMGVIVYLMKYIPINEFLLFFLQIITGVILYFGINILIKNNSLIYMIALVKQAVNGKKSKRVF